MKSFIMTQAHVNMHLGSYLLSYRDQLFDELRKPQVDFFHTCGLMYNILYILNCIIARDLPQYDHRGRTCLCKDSIGIVFNWVIETEKKLSSLLMINGIPQFSKDDCWLIFMQKKYFLAGLLSTYTSQPYVNNEGYKT